MLQYNSYEHPSIIHLDIIEKYNLIWNLKQEIPGSEIWTPQSILEKTVSSQDIEFNAVTFRISSNGIIRSVFFK